LIGSHGDKLSPGWLARQSITSDQLFPWDFKQWRDWFADGLDVWFSNFPKADRSFAFAPHWIDIDREDERESLARYLRRFFNANKQASVVLELREAIQLGALNCLSSKVVGGTSQRAEFLLDVFGRVGVRHLPEMARCSLQTLDEGELSGEAGESYLSVLSYIIFDNGTFDDVDPLRRFLEDRLKLSMNFRPALFYSLRMSNSNAAICLAKFNDLILGRLRFKDAYSWGVVAEEFNLRFGRSVMADTVRVVLETGTHDRYEVREEFIAATRLAEFYPESGPGGLFDIHQNQDEVDNRVAMRERDIAA
jgi:hypothetical protein